MLDGHDIGGFVGRPIRKLDGWNVPGEVGPDDSIVVIGPGGVGTPVKAPPLPAIRVVVHTAGGTYVEAFAYSSKPVIANAAGAIVRLNQFAKLSEWMLPPTSVRSRGVAIYPDGIETVFPIVHTLGTYMVQLELMAAIGQPDQFEYVDRSLYKVTRVDENEVTVEFFTAPATTIYLVKVMG